MNCILFLLLTETPILPSGGWWWGTLDKFIFSKSNRMLLVCYNYTPFRAATIHSKCTHNVLMYNVVRFMNMNWIEILRSVIEYFSFFFLLVFEGNEIKTMKIVGEKNIQKINRKWKPTAYVVLAASRNLAQVKSRFTRSGDGTGLVLQLIKLWFAH